MALRERNEKSDYKDMSALLERKAKLMYVTGKYDEAKALFEKALALVEQNAGE